MDAPGNLSYPIAGYSYIAYLTRNNSNFQQTRILYDYLRFVFSADGSAIISKLNFVPITDPVKVKVFEKLDLIQSGDQVISKYFNADLNRDYIIQTVVILISLSIVMLMGLFCAFTKLIDSSAAAYISQLLFYYLFVYLDIFLFSMVDLLIFF